MNISQAAEQSGLSSKTIRYYESIGLVTPSYRRENGYREYGQEKINELIFLRHARQVDFSLDECQRLLALYSNPKRRSQDVHELVTAKLIDLEQRITDLQSIKQVLEAMSLQCSNNEGADCAIIETLAGTLAGTQS